MYDKYSILKVREKMIRQHLYLVSK